MVSSGNLLLNVFSDRNICRAEVTSPIRLSFFPDNNFASRTACSIVLYDSCSVTILPCSTPSSQARFFITTASVSVPHGEPPPDSTRIFAPLRLKTLTPPPCLVEIARGLPLTASVVCKSRRRHAHATEQPFASHRPRSGSRQQAGSLQAPLGPPKQGSLFVGRLYLSASPPTRAAEEPDISSG